MKICIRNYGKVAFALSLFFALYLFGMEKAAAENITFRYIAVNPSSTKTQATKIKKYLPEEIKPKNIVDSGDLKLEFDTEKSLYYVYKNDIELAPKEVRAFEVEVEDVWLMPESKIYNFEERANSALSHLEGTKYYEKAKEIADDIYPRLEEIRTTQLDETVSRAQHIGFYRKNLITIGEIEKDLAKIEKILVTAGGPPAPEMLAKTRIKADAPTKSMTWIVIFVIIIFMGLLAGVMFFTWQRQARLTKESLLESKKSAFPESQENKEPEQNSGETASGK